MRVAKPSRRTGRLLACVFVAAVTLVSPLESGLLPTRLADLLEPSTAQAQTRATGTPEACHPGAADATRLVERFAWMAVDLDKWNANPSQAGQPADPWLRAECLLELPACPESVLSPGTLMRLSVPSADSEARFRALIGVKFVSAPDRPLYPEFCEERVIGTQPEFDACKLAKGLVVEVYPFGGGEVCRLIHPIECPTGTHRSGAQKCRAVQRRDWTCGSGYEKANQFNRCYRRGTPDANNVHPACGPGAPAFPLDPSESYQRANPNAPGTLTLSQQACAEYVGDDYTESPDCVSDFPILEPGESLTLPSNAPLTTQPQAGGSSDYWCQYDTRMLRVDCHLDGRRAPQDCSSRDTALCLKRVSHTGGCDRIVRTIRCRAYQADFAQGYLTRQEVHDAGCEPCHTLPFEVPASGCPVYRSRRPSLRNNIDPYRIIHHYKGSFAINHRYCWRNLSKDSLASADAVKKDMECQAIRVCADPPSGRVEWSGSHPSGLAVVNSTVLFNIADIPLESDTQRRLSFATRQSSPQVVFKSNPQYQYFPDARGPSGTDGRARLLTRPDDNTAYPNVGSYDGLVQDECLLRDSPRFNIVIEELWPATHADEIKRLFGDDALHWWEGDPDDADVNGLDPSEKAARTKARGGLGGLAREEVECAYDDFRTCAWSPTRSGYYKVVGAGAWMSTRNQARSWVSDDYEVRYLLGYLKDSEANRAEVQRLLTEQGLKPEDVGLNRELTDLLRDFSINGSDQLCAPLEATGNCDADWLHTTLATTVTGCAPVDLRVRCVGGYTMANYTTTEPVGLLVHEVRVNTITPD